MPFFHQGTQHRHDQPHGRKLEDVKDGINRAQIASSIPAVDGTQANASALLDANRDAANRQPTFENAHVQKIYEKFNLNDKRAQ